MGLDMYAMITEEELPQSVDFKKPIDAVELHYWRKHPDLHGWMEGLYSGKGGNGSFNLDPIVLTTADIDQLETAIERNELPQTDGYFFGQSLADEFADDLAFIAKARKAIADGYTVYYDSWW